MRFARFYGTLRVMPADSEPFTLSPKDAADRLGVHEDTLKRWAADGKVPGWKTPGGWWRFRPSDIEAILNGPSSVVADESDPAA